MTAFFVGPGLELEGRTFVKGGYIDSVIAIPDSRTEIVMLRSPEGGTGIELASLVSPITSPDRPPLWPTSWAGVIGQHENSRRMAHVRGPKGIAVSLTERIG